jgi:hypothetical protein
MKYIFLLSFCLSQFSIFSQKHVTVYTEPSDFQHRIYVGSTLPFRIHAGYELHYKRLQIGGFVGYAPKRFQSMVLDFFGTIKSDYLTELNYLKAVAEPKLQFGGELKIDLGHNFSFGATAQTFNSTLRDTPKNITQGLLPEQAKDIATEIDNLSKLSPDVKNLYETKLVDAYLNTILVGPTFEKTLWLDKNETIFIRAKVAYWIVISRQNDIVGQGFNGLEQAGVEFFRPRFISKIERISSQFQTPSFGLEMGIAF